MNQYKNPFFAFLSPSVSPYTLDTYRWQLAYVLKEIGDELTTEATGQWMIRAVLEGLSSRTISAYLKILQRFLIYCEKNCLVPCPVNWTLLPAVQRTPAKKKQTFTVEEYEKLLADCLVHEEQDWHDLIVAGYFTGLRLGDAACLLRQSVNMEQETITLIPCKTKRFGKEVTIPIAPALLAVLKRRFDSPGFPGHEDYVFGAFHLSYRTHKHQSLKRGFFWRCDRSEVARRGFHCLRHSFISKLANNEVSYGVISSMTGQSLKQIQSYHHVSVEAQRRAILKLEN